MFEKCREPVLLDRSMFYRPSFCLLCLLCTSGASLLLAVSCAGALFLLRDCKEYQEVIRDFHVPAVAESFECLRALTNLLIVAPEGLTSCAQKDPRLAKVPRVCRVCVSVAGNESIISTCNCEHFNHESFH
jgi:hypothetical protein